jgi:hypothetical protein
METVVQLLTTLAVLATVDTVGFLNSFKFFFLDQSPYSTSNYNYNYGYAFPRPAIVNPYESSGFGFGNVGSYGPPYSSGLPYASGLQGNVDTVKPSNTLRL